VGCVLVHKGKVIAKGMNATNVTRNGTRHAELMALSALFSYAPAGVDPSINVTRNLGASAVNRASPHAVAPTETESTGPSEEDGYARQGHMYPYGQKLHPSPRVQRSIIRECILYVTVEPCVMCASLLRQLNIKKVYFGAVNDKFGGTGGVFSIHLNSDPVSSSARAVSPHLLRDATNMSGPRPGGFAVPRGISTARTPGSSGGDGGNIEPGFEIEGGWGRDEAVGLLRRFYVQENGRGKFGSPVKSLLVFAYLFLFSMPQKQSR
jgi:tRNA-specific adenosine deaminase 2